MNLIERHASKTLKKFAGEFPAVLITGARPGSFDYRCQTDR